jgi:transposase
MRNWPQISLTNTDFAWKRGKRYGTVIIDLETHDLLDLLPDREAESVKRWLLPHPAIEIVSRDRGGAYADGTSQGAPQAQQIADRWHMCKNLGDAVEDYLKRQKIHIPPSPSPDTATAEVKASPPLPPPTAPVKRTRASQAKAARKQAVVDQVKDLLKEGNSIHTIAVRLDLARNTVRRYVRMEGPVQPTPRPRKPSQFDPFYDDLCQRFKDGCCNAHQLFEELQETGYRGGETAVRSFVARLRKGLLGMARPPKHAKQAASASLASPRELRWLLSRREEDLTPEEQQDLKRLLESSEEVKHLHQLLQSFLQMLRSRQPERLNG